MYFCKNNFHVQDMHFKIRPNYVFDFYFIYPISSVACNYALLLYLYSQHFAFCLQNFEFFSNAENFLIKSISVRRTFCQWLGDLIRFHSFSFKKFQKAKRHHHISIILEIYIFIFKIFKRIYLFPSFLNQSSINSKC